MDDHSGSFLAGAGRAAIAFPEGFFPFEGFYGLHDELHARTLLVDNGRGRAAIVVVELTSIRDCEELRKIAGEECGLGFEEVLLCASHTFQAPHLKPARLARDEDEAGKCSALGEAVAAAVRASARAAKAGLRPARMGLGTGRCEVNVNRDVETVEGWWKGSDPAGPSDKSLAVLRFEDLQGKPIAFFVNYAVQSSVLLDSVPADGRKLVSSDLLGAAASFLERRHGGAAVALFSVGAAGDQDPLFVANRHLVDSDGNYGRSDIGEAGYALAELLGERLGLEAARVGEGLGPCKAEARVESIRGRVGAPGQEIFPDVHAMRPSRDYVFKKAPPVELPYWILLLGDAALVGVQVELVCRTALELKAASPFRHTVVMTMVNGGAKYLPDAMSYKRITYAAMNSMGAEGSAEILRDAVVEELDKAVFARPGERRA